ncbi:hypothetical protein [Pseudomonas sp. W2Jun17]|jgi:hypothetical protein|uniref:hypothetical protein n=1 Tax=Pseudomonas sp. W2Jun17 TaxID=1553460 RepID=UPI0020048131|nr:hypothetical protein [Pseudomonas sp. W2Jun17]MCK3849963.1 hypothetical protein [Pseudomonas sp. W2Jun17]
MKMERIVVAGFAAVIITMAICTALIRKEIRLNAYSPDAVVQQLEEEGQKTRDAIQGVKREEPPIAWPPLGY